MGPSTYRVLSLFSSATITGQHVRDTCQSRRASRFGTEEDAKRHGYMSDPSEKNLMLAAKVYQNGLVESEPRANGRLPSAR